MDKLRVRLFSVALLLVMVFSLFGTAAYAREDKPTIQVFRIDDTFVIFKITFPTDITGNFAGVITGNHLDCLVVPPNVLICIGRYRVGPESHTLTIYNNDSYDVILQKVIQSPPSNGKGDEEETPAPTPAPTKEPCVECF
ncbi:MAG: hypothetical protein U0Z26_15630 [Anaerolineales bacterium]